MPRIEQGRKSYLPSLLSDVMPLGRRLPKSEIMGIPAAHRPEYTEAMNNRKGSNNKK